MKPEQTDINIRFRNKALKYAFTLLVVILAVRISTYFMISESVAITRGYKVGVRLIFTYLTWAYLKSFTKNKLGIKVEYLHVFSPLLYILYLWLGVASLAWTSDLGVSILQLIMDIECVVFNFLFWKLYLSYLVLRDISGVRFDRILWIAVCINVSVLVIGGMINPDVFYRDTHGGNVTRLGGFIINPNELGMLAVVGVAGAYADILRAGLKWYVAIAVIMMIVCLVLTSSRSSMISFVLLSGLYVLISGNRTLMAGAVIGGMLLTPIVLNEIFFKEGDAEEVMSMTGRLPFWQDLLTYNVPRKPLLGFGFMRIDEHDKFPAIHSYAGAMTHNTFMQVLLNLGLTGIVLVFWQMVFTMRGIVMLFKSKFQISILGLGMFIPLFINSLTEFGIWGETNYGIMFYLFIITMISIHRKEFFIERNSRFDDRP